ncbi:MAG: transglycosylase domain-containing protein [Bifidobacterium sp.]|nr:transglycosylase domain-containing protein [Bifidobacterium sp.]
MSTKDVGAKAGKSGSSATPNDARTNTKPAKTKAQKRRRRQLIALWTGVFLLVLILGPVVAFGSAYTVTKVPEPDQLSNNQVVTMYASDGSTQVAKIVPPDGNRTNVSLARIPEQVRNAVLAAEDRTFYTNPGFSITGFGRAVLGMITGRSDTTGGGSTITQQYVKNALVGDEHSYTRKAKELVIAAKMTNEWTKDQILEAYLNTIYFGRNAYGIAAAAQAYFAKDVQDLSVAEGAVLAAAIQRPSQLDPWTNKTAAESRWNYVLDGMVEMGVLSSTERATEQYPNTIDPSTVPTGSQADGTYGLIKNQVIAELAAAGISEQDMYQEGLKITTTIDPTTQNAIQEQVDKQMASYPQNYRTSVVSIDPKTGAVKGYYGGSDPNGWDYANTGLQTGSTFKIFGLAAALEQGIPLTKVYSSAPVTKNGITINNSDGESCGSCNLATALKMSLNTSFIRMQDDLQNGAEDTADMAHRLGVTDQLDGAKTLQEADGTVYDGVILGQYNVRTLDMATGLATLADGGVYHQTHFIQKVETSDGRVVLDRSSVEGDQRVSEDVANNVIKAMLPIAAYSRNHQLAGGRVSASKSGTAQLGDTGHNKDAWFIGATPELATAVWVGTSDAQAIYYRGVNMYGSGLPADIWKGVMDTALADVPKSTFSGAATATTTNRSSSRISTGSTSNRALGSQDDSDLSEDATSSGSISEQTDDTADGNTAGTGADAAGAHGDGTATSTQNPVSRTVRVVADSVRAGWDAAYNAVAGIVNRAAESAGASRTGTAG